MLRAAWCSCRACKDTENGVSVQTSAPFFLSIETPMRRKLALVAVVFIAIAALVVLIGFDDAPPAELKRVIVGMTVDDVLAIMVEPPTARELPCMGANCLAWVPIASCGSRDAAWPSLTEHACLGDERRT